MNKLLRLTLLLILAMVGMVGYAQTTEIDFTKETLTLDTKTGFTHTVSGFTFEALKNTGTTVPTQNGKTKDVRIYANNTLKVSGKSMTSMVYTISTAGKKRLTDLTASTGTVTVDATNWTVTWTSTEAVSEVTLTVGEKATYGTDGNTKAGQFDFDKVVITGDGGATESVESPTISGETPFSDKTTVTITVPEGTTVYYTTDGSTPSDQGDEYTDPFELTASATVKAVAYKGDAKSSVVSKEFKKTVVTTGKGTAEDPYTVADVLSLYEQGQVPTDSVYVKGKVVADVTGDDTYNNATYYISDDGTATNQYYIYRGKYIDKANFTANDLLEAGDEVVVYGKLVTYGSTDEMAANNYIITLNGGKEGKHPKSTGDDDKGGINNPYTPEEVLALTELPATEVYIKGTVVADATGTSYNNANYYISADGTTTNQLYVYRGKYLNGANFSTDITLTAGSVVVLKGKLAVFNNANQVAAGSSIVSINGQTTAINTIAADATVDAPLYNLAGQRVGNSYKGVVVKNGRKYIVK